MQVLAGVLVLVFVATSIALAQKWQETRTEVDTADVTVKGFEAFIEVLYSYRLDHPTQWPSRVSDLQPYVASDAIRSANGLGTNGDGNPYIYRQVGDNVQLSTEVASTFVAKRVSQTFGSRSTLTNLSEGFRITVNVPPPGGVSLLQSSLLIDGSNKLDRPLWFSTTQTAGQNCSGGGISVDSSGQVVVCQSGKWQTL